MDKYYYLSSQLPFLRFNEKTSIDQSSFLAEARKWLDEKEFLILSGVDINDFSEKVGDPDKLKEYKYFEKTLREDIAIFRGAKKKGSGYKPKKFSLTDVLKGTPLDIEKKLLMTRWGLVEQLEESHYFDLEFLILYFLKLQILQRLFSFDKEKGITIFDKLCEVTL